MVLKQCFIVDAPLACQVFNGADDLEGKKCHRQVGNARTGRGVWNGVRTVQDIQNPCQGRGRARNSTVVFVKVKVKCLPHVAGGILDGMEKDVGAEPTGLAAMGFANKSGNAEEGCVGMKHDFLAMLARMPQNQSDPSHLFPLIIRKEWRSFKSAAFKRCHPLLQSLKGFLRHELTHSLGDLTADDGGAAGN